MEELWALRTEVAAAERAAQALPADTQWQSATPSSPYAPSAVVLRLHHRQHRSDRPWLVRRDQLRVARRRCAGRPGRDARPKRRSTDRRLRVAGRPCKPSKWTNSSLWWRPHSCWACSSAMDCGRISPLWGAQRQVVDLIHCE